MTESNEHLIEGLIWGSRTSGSVRNRVRISHVDDDVTYEINEKINDGADYADSNWGFKGTLKTVSREEFTANYRYLRWLNMEHEYEVAKAHLETAYEVVLDIMDLDHESSENLLNLLIKTVLNEAALRVERMEWDSGCCGYDVDKAAEEIESELTAEEIERLNSF